MTNELPDLDELEAIFNVTQLQKIKKDSIACFTCDSHSGVGAFCFCDDLEEWKTLYPAIIFIEALIDKDYDIYDPTDLKELTNIYVKYQDVKWKNTDFQNFKWDVSLVVFSYDIEFIGKTSQLFEQNPEDEFIERLLQSFKDNPKKNEEDYLEFLSGYGT